MKCPYFLASYLSLVVSVIALPKENVSQFHPKETKKCSCPDSGWSDPLPRIVKVDPETKQFIDEHGRSRFFHGTNLVSKAWPYHPTIGDPENCKEENMADPISPLCDDYLDYLQGLGINAIRLGVMWAGAEPERGVYNCSYFCVIHETIQKLADRGIYTMADVHQDVLARQMCGEGVPDWFMKKDWLPENQRFPRPLQNISFETDDEGVPEPWSQCWTITDWFTSYFSFASADAFEKFYTNHDGLLDAFADYWGKIALELKDYNSVMGYDLLNEPWAGDIYKDPTLLVPGIADKKHLEGVWAKVALNIREVDPATIIFFEGVTWDIEDGHSQVPGGNGSLAAMSYHYYSPPQLGLEATFQLRKRDQERLETGGILTEFRMWGAEGGESKEKILKGIKDTIEMGDNYLQSWMGWGYRSIRDRNPDIAKLYSRTYAQAVAGTVLYMGFVEETGYYWLEFQVGKGITADTEIKFVKKYYYDKGVKVNVSPEGWATWEIKEEGIVAVKLTGLAQSGKNLTVEIYNDIEDVIDDSGVCGKSTSVSRVITFTVIMYLLIGIMYE